jgi:GPH family glycoside/pentoside/hexuronide:cation symporter
MGLGMPWLFQFDPSWSVLTIGIWMVIFNLLIQTTQTIYGVPYQSLLLESTSDSNERTNVAAWRGFVGLGVGLVVNWSWWLSQRPIFHVDGEPDVLNGIKWLVIMAAVPVILLGILPAIFMEERFYKLTKTQKKTSIREDLKATSSNRPFLLLLAFICVFVGGGGLHWGLVFYVKLFYVCGGDQELASQIAGFQGSAQAIMAAVGIPAARSFALRLGKMKSIVLALCLGVVAYLSTYFLLTPKAPYLSIIPFVLLGPVMSMIWVIIPSMLGDIVDHDELTSHKRLEGAYSAVFGWSFKVARTVSSVLSGPIVVWAGYEAAKRHELAQNFEVLGNMRLLLMILPTTFMVIAGVILWLYPLDASVVAENRRKLEAYRGEL